MKRISILIATTCSVRKTVLRRLFTMLLLCFALQCPAQFYSVKTNLLEWGMMGTMNAEASMMVASKWTIHFDLALNPWTFSNNKKMKHWLIEPGVRYWLWQTYTGGFISLYGIATRFNGGFNKRYDGYGLGAGATYGYAWALGKRWNVEAEAGIGALWSRYSTHECRHCGEQLKPVQNYFLPSPKVSLGIVYLF